ncbi:glutathione S-transferase N-terminal domain-containing protein [Pendulispora brunnea]|uniref:Glutathione S-transferase N-terminal domain-containing protein n=1 Tax=Pendulispora brunnea TaxID=2905690 RepID=A0ABZ2KTR9_9BACT
MAHSMTLFYAPHVCSLAPHIVLRELGIAFELERVDLRTKRTARGDDFHAINPKGYVPALRFADGSVLTETAIIMRHLADTYPESGLAPIHGSALRLRFDEWLHFVATELHKGFTPLTIMAGASEESKRWAASRLSGKISLLEGQLRDRDYLFGDRFTILDAYGFWAIRNYATLTKADLSSRLLAYRERMQSRPSIRAALDAEGHRLP